MHRLVPFILASLCFVALAVACGGDDDGEEASRTPFIAPPSLAQGDAITEVEEIILQVENPDTTIIGDSGIGEFELMTRITEIVEGTAQVPGLNQIRQELEDGDRILAREYLHNNVIEVMAIPFSETDTVMIDAEALATLDPLNSFADSGEPFEVSAIFRDAVLRAIELWYLI